MLVSPGLMMSGGRPSADAAPPNTPVNTAAPVITGTATVGQILTVSNGTWTNSPTGYARQWKRDSAVIVGAVGATYALVAADEGKMISADVTATNAEGSNSAAAVAVGPVIAVAVSGQQMFTAAGSFVVPANVISICAVVIGSGGRYNADFLWAGGGGGLSYVNNIPVTPGETLTIALPFGDNEVSSLSRGGTELCAAYNGDGPAGSGPKVGTGFAGGNRNNLNGGGAGGYTGAGGTGAGTGNEGGFGTSPNGGGVGAAGGANGPNVNGKNYGGGAGGLNGAQPGGGCVRIIYGAGRAFPNTNTGDI